VGGHMKPLVLLLLRAAKDIDIQSASGAQPGLSLRSLLFVPQASAPSPLPTELGIWWLHMIEINLAFELAAEAKNNSSSCSACM
jgi:hypothetical protein